MTPFLWLLAFLLSLISLTYQISALVAAVRARATSTILVQLAVLAVFLVPALVLRQPVLVLVLAAVALAISQRVLGTVTRSAMHASKTTQLSATHLALLAGTVLFMIPFVWLLSTSLKTDDEQAVFPPVWIPTQQITSPTIKREDGKPAPLSTWHGQTVAETADLPSGQVRVKYLTSGQTEEAGRSELEKIRQVAPRWQNYAEALAYLPPETHYGLTFLWNTLFLTALTVIGTVLSSALVAYSFARLRWPGRNILFGVLLATMMVPGAVTMMPQFLIFRSLGWIDTLRPLWVPAFFGAAFNIFLLRQFFLSIPTELEDAAKIDGCGPLGTWWRVMLPQVKPALAAIAILATLAAWNNFQGPLIYLSSPEKMPLAYGLQLYQQQHNGEPGLLMAASTLVVLPIIVLFFFTQRYFIEGVSLSGLGGR